MEFLNHDTVTETSEIIIKMHNCEIITRFLTNILFFTLVLDELIVVVVVVFHQE